VLGSEAEYLRLPSKLICAVTVFIYGAGISHAEHWVAEGPIVLFDSRYNPPSISSVVLTRLSRPRSKPTTFQTIW
jgi:hypothetical protein